MFHTLSATKMSKLIHSKQVKPSEVCDAIFKHAMGVEPYVSAFITNLENDYEKVFAQAKALDDQPLTDETPALFGIPVAVKDNIVTEDMPTTCASLMLKDYMSVFDATVVTRIKQNQGIIMGKVNLDEFAMGSSGHNSSLGINASKNPRDLTRIAGGSSSGSAVAVGSFSAPIALGSDTGGSIRQPAAFCGVVGYKPSHGAVSRYGLVSYAPQLDQIGPLARTVSDAALIAQVISGYDPYDARTNPNYRPDFRQIEGLNLRGKKIGLINLSKVLDGLIEPDIDTNIQDVKTFLKALGVEIINIELSMLEYCVPMYYAITMSEGSASLSRFDGVRFGYSDMNVANIDAFYTNNRSESLGSEVKKRMMLGHHMLSKHNIDTYYKKARLIQAKLTEEINQAFEHCDVLISPTAPTVAPRTNTKAASLYASDYCTVPANIAGLPAISIPVGLDKRYMPIGLQIMGRRFDDVNVLKFARAIEREVNQ